MSYSNSSGPSVPAAASTPLSPSRLILETNTTVNITKDSPDETSSKHQEKRKENDELNTDILDEADEDDENMSKELDEDQTKPEEEGMFDMEL